MPRKLTRKLSKKLSNRVRKSLKRNVRKTLKRNVRKTLKRNVRKTLKRNVRKTLKRNTRKSKRSRRVNRRRNMRGGVRQSVRVLRKMGAHVYDEGVFLQLMDTVPPDAILLLGQTSAILANPALSAKIEKYVGHIPVYVGAYHLNRYAQKPGGYEEIVAHIYENFKFNELNGTLENIDLQKMSAIENGRMLSVFFDICVGGTLTDSRDRDGIEDVMKLIWWPLQNYVNGALGEVKYCGKLGQTFSLNELNTGHPTDVSGGSSFRSNDNSPPHPIAPLNLEDIQAQIKEVLSGDKSNVYRKAFMTALGSGLGSNLRTVKILTGDGKLRGWEMDSYSTDQMIQTNQFINELVGAGGGMVYFSDPGRSARIALSDIVQARVSEFHRELDVNLEPPVTKLIDLYAGVQVVNTQMHGINTRGEYRGEMRIPDISDTLLQSVSDLLDRIGEFGVETALKGYVEEVTSRPDGGPPFKNIFIQTDCLHKRTEPDDFFAIYLISLICENLIISFDSHELGDIFVENLIENLPSMRINAVWTQLPTTGNTGYYVAHLTKI